MSHLSAVPDLPDEDYFTTIPVCATCPPGSTGFSAQKQDGGWRFTLWHLEPCPRADEPPSALLVPGCNVCHTRPDSDVLVSSLLPGRWILHHKHGTGPDGELCPVLALDGARFGRMGTGPAS